jgi:hypothetical protein
MAGSTWDLHNRIADDETPNDAIARHLHAAGWSVGKIAVGSRSLVTSTNGENCGHAAAGSQAAVWELAVRQAEAAGGPGIGSGAWGSRSRSPALWCFLIALALFVSYASMDPSVDARLGGRVNNMGLPFGKWFGSMISASVVSPAWPWW